MDPNLPKSNGNSQQNDPTSLNVSTSPQSSQNEHGQKRESRNTFWTMDEDFLLINAWLSTNLDPGVDVEKANDGFWRGVHKYFTEHSPTRVKERTQATMSARWYRASRMVQKFCAIFDEVVQLNTSGKCHEDLVASAHVLYIQNHKSKFQLDHWWKALRDQPKWKMQGSTPIGGSSKRAKINEMGVYSDSSTQGSGDQSTSVDLESEDLAQPIEMKVSNGKGKTKATTGVDEVSIEVSKMNTFEVERNEMIQRLVSVQEQKFTTYKEALNLRKESIKLKKESVAMKRDAYEVVVMSKDVSTMTPEEATFWNAKKASILKRYNQTPENNG